MKIRNIVFWSHLVVGVAAGLIVLAMAATGVLLTYEVQITRWAETRAAGVEPGGARLDADTLAEAARVATGGQVEALVFENDPAAPVSATFGRRDRLLLDPYSGEALGDGETATARAFEAITGFHRWLSLTGMNQTGAALTGAANLGFGFLLLSGAWLWLPRIWKWGMFRVRMLFRAYPNAQARDFHWHHIFAFWSVVPLAIIIFTGITMSYDRAEGAVMTLVGVGGEDEARAETEPHAAEGGANAGLDAALALAMAHDPAWRRVVLTLPAPGAHSLKAVVDTGPGRRMTRQEELTIALDGPRILAVERFADRPKAVRTFMFLRFAHSGEHYGLLGQTVAGLASLASLFMVYTGLALAWRRLVAPALRRFRHRRAA